MADKLNLPERSIPAHELISSSKAGWLLLIAAIIIALVYYWPEKKPAPSAAISEQNEQKNLNHQPVHSELMNLEEHRWKPFRIDSNHFRVDPPVGKTIRIKLENGMVFQKRNNRLFRESDGKEVSCIGQGIGLEIYLAAGKGEDVFGAMVSIWPQDDLNMLDSKECKEVK